MPSLSLQIFHEDFLIPDIVAFDTDNTHNSPTTLFPVWSRGPEEKTEGAGG